MTPADTNGEQNMITTVQVQVLRDSWMLVPVKCGEWNTISLVSNWTDSFALSVNGQMLLRKCAVQESEQ